MTTTAEIRKHREQLLAMVLDLQANRIILDELVNCYGVFLFTGGVVAEEHWGLLAMTSYLHAPFAADRISAAKAERYQQLAATIVDQGQAIWESPNSSFAAPFWPSATSGWDSRPTC